MNLKALFLSLAFLTTSCISVTWPVMQSIAANDSYQESTNRANMSFSIDTTTFEGTAVILRKTSQIISFNIPTDTIRLMITTCNREEFFLNPKTDKPFAYNFIPVMYVENLDSCLLTATAITKNGETRKAIIDFLTGEQLTGISKCNGKTKTTKGVDFCQSRAGLIQVIEFNEQVVNVAQDGCPPLTTAFGAYAYQYKIGSGFCSYRFMNKNKDVFRLTTYGYTSIKDALSTKE